MLLVQMVARAGWQVVAWQDDCLTGGTILEFGGLVAIKATRVSVAKPGHSCSVGGEHQQRSEHLSSGGTEYHLILHH